MACDPQSLVSAASCIECNVPNGMQLPLIIYLLCQIQSGGSSVQLFSHFTDAPTVSTNLTPLYTDTIPGNTLTVAGNKIVAEYIAAASFGGVAYSAATTFTFAGQSIWSQSTSLSTPASYDFTVIITMTGSSTARVTVIQKRDFGGGSPSDIVNIQMNDLVGLNWAISNNLVFNGQTSTAAQTVTAKQAYAQVLR
jgi:hypothetical protein